ncbi:MAG: hypothetical protein ACSW8G_03315 [Bacillota bacterium]
MEGKTSVNKIYENCLWSAAAHAVYVVINPYFAAEQSWDGENYSFLYGETRGTISFDMGEGILAGAARDAESERCKGFPDADAMDFFAQAPDKVKELAEQEAIQYLFDEVDGVEKPMITTAFWGKDGEVTIPDGEEFSEHGGEYPLIMFSSFEEVRAYWLGQYKLSADETALADYIFNARLSGQRTLNRKEMKKICKVKDKEAGYGAYIESLAEMGLTIG